MLGKTGVIVKVKKQDLLNALKENKDKHINDYNKARENYLIQILDKLEAFIDLAAGGKIPENGFHIGLREPELQAEEYNKYINMLELATDDVLEITSIDFDYIVNDNWDWIKHSKVVNTTYINWRRNGN